MILLTPEEIYWTFIFLFLVVAMLTIVIGYILARKAPTKVKRETFECGQEVDIHVHDTYIKGAERYFAYAVAFFILDAFTWILIASVNALKTYLFTTTLIVVYIVLIMIVLAYYISKLREVFRP